VYDDRFFEELAPFLPTLRRAMFKGGEPFLSPQAARVWELMIDLAPTCDVAVTTNGTVWSPRVERTVRELRMQVNLSVDGVTPEVLEAIRVGVDATDLWRNVDRFQRLAAETGRQMALVFSLVRANWRELVPFLVECERRALDATVIVVTQPSSHSLLALPPSTLDALVAELCEQAAAAPSLRRTQAAWDGALAKLRAAGATTVAIGSKPKTPGDLTLDELRDLLRRQSPAEPLLIETVGADVTSVLAAPAWSDRLTPRRWVGRRSLEIGQLISEALGVEIEPEVVQQPDGTVRASIPLHDDAWPGIPGLVVHAYPPPRGRLAPQVIAMVPALP
jgi:hypothetical protein